jgi:hypothetical protein
MKMYILFCKTTTAWIIFVTTHDVLEEHSVIVTTTVSH